MQATPVAAVGVAREVAATAESVAPAVDDFEPEPPPGEFGDPGFDPGRDPDYDPQYDASLGNEGIDPLEAVPEPARDSARDAAQHEAKDEAQDETQSSADAGAGSAMPSFTRYGEAVVREVLGARFIEERPLPEGFRP